MNSRQSKILAELNTYYPRDWEEFYYDSAKIKAIKKEMDALGEKLLAAAELGWDDGSMARAAHGIRGELETKKHHLIDAIAAERKTRADSAQKKQAAEAEEKRIGLATDANKISKNAQKLSKISIAVAIGLGLLTICTQIGINLTKEDRIKQQVIKQLEEQAISILQKRIDFLENQNSEIKKRLDEQTTQLNKMNASRSKKSKKVSANNQPQEPTPGLPLKKEEK